MPTSGCCRCSAPCNPPHCLLPVAIHLLESSPTTTTSTPLADFICASPLLPSCGINRAQVEAEADRWLELGSQVISNLGLPPLAQLLPAQK